MKRSSKPNQPRVDVHVPENMPGTKRRAEGEESDLLSIRPL